jgi:hypothetical protein
MQRDRSKTLPALVGAEPLVQAQEASVQRLQFFLSERICNADAASAGRLSLLAQSRENAPSAGGMQVIDDVGDHKDRVTYRSRFTPISRLCRQSR